ncbi:NAD(P)-dependent oxidoreductase [Ureibacillus endophyticus]|uniref:NAD(P)-dependent oxidoreductase n=1 Tax=Ureibacillus endophyticus TaxID=1978490 RepID=A0A494ZAC8_9BACL|nr:NAD(P)H-binding protein [Lysinibacillus endophyticus]RKQ19570.1 NAD(P)-dependent oxidoreductase [Lysinibacillus endophyticus]
MKIGIIGASSKAGRNIIMEAKMRNHEITAFVREKEKLIDRNIKVVKKEGFQLTKRDLMHFDVLINAYNALPGEKFSLVELGRHLINQLEGTNTRLFVVGGPGSLFIDRECKTRLIDIPEFPQESRKIALQQLQNLTDLKKSSIKWTFLSPSPLFDSDGPRTGHYILGKNRLLLNSQQISYVSYADYAVAVLDEIERPKHVNEQFTVASENATSAS